jgi:Na+/melibiose symporter-like transporter
MERSINNQDCIPPKELKGGRLWGYSTGILGQILPVTLINAYLFQYYVYTIGLDPLLVSVGTALGAVINGIGGPLFGVITDNKTPTKFGKRRPFLLYGLPILSLALILVWIPPILPDVSDTMDIEVALFLWIVILAFFINFSLIRSPYLSMLPEQSEVEANRVKISSIQGIFSIIASILGILLPMILQSRLINPRDVFHTTADGQFLMQSLPILAGFFAILSIIFILLAFFSTDESFHLQKTNIPIEKKINATIPKTNFCAI